jgi:hypothetical protein
VRQRNNFINALKTVDYTVFAFQALLNEISAFKLKFWQSITETRILAEHRRNQKFW